MGAASKMQVPVKLTLAQSENVSSAPVKPVYLLAPRESYLPALAEQALSSFEHVLLQMPGQGPGGRTPWFELRGAPVNWTFPCGVLFDLVAPPPPLTAPLNATTSSSSTDTQTAAAAAAAAAAGVSTHVPWPLVVHYRDMPSGLVPAWSNAAAAVRDQYFTSLKEALYICRGAEGANAVMRMAASAQDELWRGVVSGKAPEDAPGWAALRAAPAVRQGAGPFIPVRAFIVPSGDDRQGAVWERAISTSRPLEALQPDGTPTTLAHALHTLAPALFPDAPPAAAAAVAPTAPTAAAVAATALPAAAAEEAGGEEEPEGGAAAAGEEAAAAAAGEGQEQQQIGEEGNPGAGEGGAAAAGEGKGEANEQPSDGGAESGAAADSATATREGEAAAAAPPPPPPTPPAAAAAATASSDGGEGSSEQPRSSGGGGGGGGSQTAAAAALQEALAAARSGPAPNAAAVAEWAARVAARARVVVAGVQPPPHAPLAWLHARLRAADCFLYLVVHMV